MLSGIMQSDIMLTVAMQCHYAKGHLDVCLRTQWHYTECHHANCYYAMALCCCHNACLHPKCHFQNDIMLTVIMQSGIMLNVAMQWHYAELGHNT